MQSPLSGAVRHSDDLALQHARHTPGFSRLAGLPMAVAGAIMALSLAGCGEAPPLFSPEAQVPGLTTDSDLRRGRQLVRDRGCVACHTVPGVAGPGSKVGPPLDNLALRGYIGGVLPNTPGNLVRWLLDPPAIDSRTAMPDMGLSLEEARSIAAYLLTLH